MPTYCRPPRALVAVAILPLSTVLACASGRASREATGPVPPPGRSVGDTTSIPPGDGKTLENLFAGRFSGVMVTPVDGGGLQIRIRGGTSSFYSGEEPLFVVDDTPMPPGTGGIVYLSPNDIQKIEVLKNPADIGVYGIRGANGVIKITTTRPGRR